MMLNLRKTALLLLLLAIAMCLSACYQDVDPWPVSMPLNTDLPPTAVPTQEPHVSQLPTATTVPYVEATVVPMPIAQPADDFWDAEPTEVPGGSADPGVNG